MKIDLTSLIGNDGFKIPFSFELSKEEEDLSIKAKVTGLIFNTLGIMQIEADISAALQSICARCLECAAEEIKLSIKEKVEEDENLEGSLLNVGNMALQNIYLNMPLRFLCRSDCKGLCAECGANLNNKPCKCSDQAIDERLSILKKLLD